ncbi:MAG: flagellar basal body L-ring protein FlgH [Rhodospirillales bacterium]|nr:flagellar basal body L-ring protein FlgH [Rhodospirillales bacterium]
MLRSTFRFAALAGLSLALTGCNAVSRLSEVGSPPKVSKIDNPAQHHGFRPVTMPMPMPEHPQQAANSLWRPGARAFFKDQRAGRIGDILTVTVNMEDEAKLNNKTTRSRSAGESAGLPNFLGYEASLARVLPEDVSASDLVSLSSEHSSVGNGELEREETVKVSLAAVITQILPNGNLVIAGKQEVRINYELRELTVSGVIRPEDISSNNTVSSEKIAEARISYGGRGVISDLQQPRYGQQIFDILFPF